MTLPTQGPVWRVAPSGTMRVYLSKQLPQGRALIHGAGTKGWAKKPIIIDTADLFLDRKGAQEAWRDRVRRLGRGHECGPINYRPSAAERRDGDAAYWFAKNSPEPSHDEMLAKLRGLGFVCGARDPRLNTRYPGAFMVVEDHDKSELPTEDGSNGPWCIVGDDFPALVKEAWGIWAEEYAENERRALEVARACHPEQRG